MAGNGRLLKELKTDIYQKGSSRAPVLGERKTRETDVEKEEPRALVPLAASAKRERAPEDICTMRR